MRRHVTLCTASLALLPLLGCFSPGLPEIECSPRGRCPSGQSCHADGFCRASSENPIDEDGATRLVAGSGLFDVVRVDTGFLVAVDTGEVSFFHVSFEEDVTPVGTAPATGPLTFVALERDSRVRGYLVTRDDDGLRRSYLDFETTAIEAIGEPITGDLDHIDATSAGYPDGGAALCVSFHQGDVLRFLNTGTIDEAQSIEAAPSFTSLSLTSYGYVLLYEQSGVTRYWRPTSTSAFDGVLDSNLSTVALVPKGAKDVLAAVHGDGSGHIHLLAPGPSLGAGSRFDLGDGALDPQSGVQIVEGPLLDPNDQGEPGTGFGVSYRVVSQQGRGDLHIARPVYRHNSGFITDGPAPILVTTAADHDVGLRHRLAYHELLARYLLIWEDTRQGEAGIYFRTIAAD